MKYYFKHVSSRSDNSDTDSDCSVSYDRPTIVENTLLQVATPSGNTLNGYFLQSVPIDFGDGRVARYMLIEFSNHGLAIEDKSQSVTVLFQGQRYEAVPIQWKAPYLDAVVYLSTIEPEIAEITVPYDVEDKGLSQSSRVSVPVIRDGRVVVSEFHLSPNPEATQGDNPFVFVTKHHDAEGRAYDVQYVHLQGAFEPGDSGAPVLIHAKPDYRFLGRLSYLEGPFAKVILTGQEADFTLFGDFVPTGDLRTAFVELTKKKPFVAPTYAVGKSFSIEEQVDLTWHPVLQAFEAAVNTGVIGHWELYSTEAKSFSDNPTVRGHHQSGYFKLYLDAEEGKGTSWRATYLIDTKTKLVSFSGIFKGH